MALWFRIALPAALLLFGVVGFFAAVDSCRVSLSGLLALCRRVGRRMRLRRASTAAEVVGPGAASGS